MKKNSLMKEILSWVIELAVIVVISFLIVTYIGQRTVVDGESMLNTLHDGESLIIDKVSGRFKDYDRFEIVVFRYQNRKDEHFIKRVIGLPGETVQIIGDDIYINGEILEEDFGRDGYIEDPGRASEPITLGPDEYFVMGDNRNNSRDGRDPSVGNVPKSTIDGRAILRIWPLSEFGTLN